MTFDLSFGTAPPDDPWPDYTTGDSTIDLAEDGGYWDAYPEEDSTVVSIADAPSHTATDSFESVARLLDVDVAVELDEYLADDSDEEYDWLLPGLLERGDRLVLTGAEGGGKSTLLRQLGIQLASGIHPFGGPSYQPLRVLLLDLENSDRQIKRKMRPLRHVAGDRYKRGNMFVRSKADGLDLLTAEDRGYLVDLVEAIRPDVLITGPIYKMAGGDPTEEKPAKQVATILDKIRVHYGCAVLLETHSPHASNGGKRPERPYGASLWLRWPEFGLYLDKDSGALRHWRGGRDERDWPAALQRGGTWPWSPVTRPRDLLWAQIITFATEDPAISRRDLAKLTNSSVGSVNRTIDEHRVEWDQLTREAS
jgi:hypothetical protein